MNWKNIFLGTGVAVFFSILYLLGFFDRLGHQVYDYYLRFRAERERSDMIVFLGVDDNAIAFNGVFPWPRSITADGLLRLKEFGALAAIFDIEFIDRGHRGVDDIYLNHGLSADFNRTFSEIESDARDLLQAIQAGWLRGDEIAENASLFLESIRQEQKNLYTRAQRVARDNDHYLVQASLLFGRSWSSINLRESPLTDAEQISRRPMAEELFSHPVIAGPNAFYGKYVDILPTFPGFARSAKGGGFTNVEVDIDGIRRRIDLAQNIFGHWYLQLAFAPLIHYLGNPEIELDRRRLTVRNANMPDGGIRDINIPLDGNGRMLLDWPREDYTEKYTHISFYNFSLLESLEAQLEIDSREFANVEILFFAQFDPSLFRVHFIVRELIELFDAVRETKDFALEYTCEDSFWQYVEYRRISRELIHELLRINPAALVNEMVPDLVEHFPEIADGIEYFAAGITNLSGRLEMNLERYEEISSYIESIVRGRFCILGRVDTGTTDIGSNPFHALYINVGTHGVVLDMILSEVFITPVSMPWRVLFSLVIVFMFLFASTKFPPVPRALSGFGITLFVILITGLLFRYTGIFFNPLLSVISLLGAVILREIISYAGSEREKQFIRKAFSTYVSNDVVREIIADPTRLQLGGTKRHMTAVFTDVKGFSGISEQLDPEHLVSLLNNYLTHMSDVILEKKGTIDKYIGDAIIAFFGAPIPMEDHALQACYSAIAMKKIEAELNKKILEDKTSPVPLLTRIGINTGSMVAGNMGTENKMNYTIMGSTVNLAARLEGVNKTYGTWILAADDTIQETNGRIFTRRLDRVRVVGINKPVQIHELINTAEDVTSEEKKLVEVFHEALDLYQQRKWELALEGFREAGTLENGGPSAEYIKRCEVYAANPPRDSWDGVVSMTEK